MKRPVPKKWLEPFRLGRELGASDYEEAFTPRLPRRTALTLSTLNPQRLPSSRD